MNKKRCKKSKKGGWYGNLGVRAFGNGIANSPGQIQNSVVNNPAHFESQEKNDMSILNNCNNLEELSNMDDSWDIRNKYRACCPKTWVGKNSSVYCKILENKFNEVVTAKKNIQKEDTSHYYHNDPNQNAVYVPPRKKWLGIFGGRKTKRRH